MGGEVLDHQTLQAMETAYGLGSCTNTEIEFKWIRLGLKARWGLLIILKPPAAAPAPNPNHRSTIHGSRLALLLGRRNPARPLSCLDLNMYWQQKEDDPSKHNSLEKQIVSN